MHKNNTDVNPIRSICLNMQGSLKWPISSHVVTIGTHSLNVEMGYTLIYGHGHVIEIIQFSNALSSVLQAAQHKEIMKS